MEICPSAPERLDWWSGGSPLRPIHEPFAEHRPCDFKYSGDVIEMQLLGLVAYRVGKKLEYDDKAGRVTNCDEANELLSRKYRKGWVLDG